MAAQQCSRPIGDELCIFHPGKKLIFECKDCPGEQLACITCVSSTHKKHDLVELKHCIQAKILNIESFIKNTQESTLPEIVKEIQSTITSLKENENEHKEKISKVMMHGVILREQVDIFTAENVSKLEFSLTETSDMLKNHIRDLENLQQKLEINTQECENTVKSGTDVSIHDREVQVVKTAATLTIPKIPRTTIPTFNPCKDPKPHIEKAFGVERETKPGDGKNIVGSVTPQLKVLDKPTTLYNTNTSYSVSWNCMSATLATMILYGTDDKLHLIDETGKEQHTLKPRASLFRMCTHPETGELFCTTLSDNSIRQIDIHTGETCVMFTTDSRTWGIGCTTDNHLAITHYRSSTLCIYNFTGKAISTYRYNYAGDRGAGVSICNRTNKIALIQYDEGVTVLNNTLEKLYTYKGQGTKLMEEFYATSAVFVDEYLLVGERQSVLMIENGRLLKEIQTREMSMVRALYVQQDPCVLYVGCNNPNKIVGIKFIASNKCSIS